MSINFEIVKHKYFEQRIYVLHAHLKKLTFLIHATQGNPVPQYLKTSFFSAYDMIKVSQEKKIKLQNSPSI